MCVSIAIDTTREKKKVLSTMDYYVKLHFSPHHFMACVQFCLQPNETVNSFFFLSTQCQSKHIHTLYILVQLIVNKLNYIDMERNGTFTDDHSFRKLQHVNMQNAHGKCINIKFICSPFSYHGEWKDGVLWRTDSAPKNAPGQFLQEKL